MSDILSCPEQEALLRTEGIMAKGYGLIPKMAMAEPSLSLTAKAIYAYLCSLAGSGETAFPSRDNILGTLRINKETFYKHFKHLTQNGWVSVLSSKSASHFAHNIYILASKSCEIVQSRNESASSSGTLHGMMVSEGIRRAGYGMLPRMVMQSPQLSHKAKAVYAYFCSFAGAGESAFPSRETILYHLDVSHPTYYKALHELINAGYLAVRQRQERGRFAICDYYLLDTPCERIPYTGKPDAEKQPAENPDAEKSDAKKPYPAKPPTTNNSPIINSPKKISSSSNSPSISYEDWQCTLDDEPVEIANMLAKMDRMTISKYIQRDIGLDIIELLNPVETREKVQYLVNLVADAMFYPNLRIAGTEYPPWQFQKKLLCLSLEEYQFVIKRVNMVQGVRNLKAYYLACLFNAHEDLEAAIDQEVQADFNT